LAKNFQFLSQNLEKYSGKIQKSNGITNYANYMRIVGEGA